MSILDRIIPGSDAAKTEETETPSDVVPMILGSYLDGFIPVDSYTAGVAIKSTDDIISDLASMADLTQEQVNWTMASLGYRPGRNSAGSFGWMMKKINM